MLVKVSTADLPAAMAQIERVFKENIPSMFEFTFLDQHLQMLYQTEQRLAVVIFIFAALAIFIACLGLYALAAYTTERRKKEIGIRKVLGASLADVFLLLSREFIVLLCISIIIAWPVAWWMMDRWLQNFAYRTDLDWYTFVLAGVIALAVAALTVGFQALKAATADPVRSLRYE